MFHHIFMRTKLAAGILVPATKVVPRCMSSLDRDDFLVASLTWQAEKDHQLHIAREKLIAQLDESLERQQQKEGEAIIKEQIDNFDEEVRYNDVLGRIRNIYDDDAEHTIKHQYDLYVKKHPDASAKEITKEISKKLVTGKTDRRSVSRKKTSESIKTDAMAAFVKSHYGDPNDPFAE